jgi:hypothetical protein
MQCCSSCTPQHTARASRHRLIYAATFNPCWSTGTETKRQPFKAKRVGQTIIRVLPSTVDFPDQEVLEHSIERLLGTVRDHDLLRLTAYALSGSEINRDAVPQTRKPIAFP